VQARKPFINLPVASPLPSFYVPLSIYSYLRMHSAFPRSDSPAFQFPQNNSTLIVETPKLVRSQKFLALRFMIISLQFAGVFSPSPGQRFEFHGFSSFLLSKLFLIYPFPPSLNVLSRSFSSENPSSWTFFLPDPLLHSVSLNFRRLRVPSRSKFRLTSPPS